MKDKVYVVEPNGIYNTVQVSEILNMNHQTAVKFCKDGRLPARKIAGKWFLAGSNILLMLKDLGRLEK